MADNENVQRDVICVNLYGDGRRCSRLRAEYIYCGSYNKCSAYAEGKCFCVTTLFGRRCPVGSVSKVDGGTKQSKMYARINAEARSHEKYGSLKYPNNMVIARIGDDAFLAIPYVEIVKEQDGALSVTDPLLSSRGVFLEAEYLNPDNVKKMCSFRPNAIMGGEIRDYQMRTVPKVLQAVKDLFPELFAEFVSKYPDFEIKPVDYVGRYARLSTCSRSETYKDSVGNVFRLDGDYAVCDSYNSAFAPFQSSGVEIRIRLNDSMHVKITSNGQVAPETVFVD